MMFKLLVCALSTTSALKVGDAPKPSVHKALALRGGGLSLETSSLILALYNGGFGVTLLADPEKCYGKDGLVPYFSSAFCPTAKFMGRMFGAMLTGVAAMHFLDGPSVSLCKLSAVASALMYLPFALALNDPDNFIPMMFKAQVVIHAAYIYIVGSAGGLF
eukprot:CAMPEP_0119056792 /NCGR_PEP_ID=MMETSP1178-20130426/1362_1 /TAXON_ID=33656 /ORGANISM="unid sp, Strain CCMP2000" /LENGTH=160 /DNA_ID=CAMNT_0007037557 /DNA_START=102 /DNA_END=584 /DNA_ORIENTATION=-